MSDKGTRDNPLGLADPYKLLVQGVQDYAVFLLDREGYIASWNRGAERLKGYAADEIIGKHFSVFYPREANERRWPQQELKAAREVGRLADEGWRLRKDGSRFWADVIITAMYDEAGELRGFSKVTRDLTGRKMQEELLRQSEERFRLLVESVKDYAIFMLDREGRVTSWNAGAQRIHGYDAEEIIGQPLAAFYPQEAVDKKWPEQELAMAREHGRFEEEGPRRRKDGSTFWARVALTPIYDHEGVLLGYAKVTRDLTDSKRVETLEKAERQTNEFLGMLAHELRNPLAPISNALQLLDARPAADATEKWVREVLQRQTAHLTRLVEDLLDVSRIRRSTISLERKPLDVRDVLSAAVDGSMPWMMERGHTLSVEFAPAAPLGVLGDEMRITQIVQNLLHNAAKYTPPGGKILLSARREDGEVLIAVKDNGVGMDAELLESAFNLFKQGQQPLHRPHGGLGVGLTLVHRLVRMHDGTVQARSAGPNQGSEFIVRLPAADARAAAPQAKPSQPSSPPRRVLVIDDNNDAANALRLLLENDGHEVKVAHDGAAGLELAREYRPDYLLLDIGLPRLSGYEIAASVRSDPRLSSTTIVAITGYGQLHDRVRTAAVGFDYHLTKPVEFSALQELFRERA
jgi:PAS domain S-box-containing protein